MFHGSVGTFFDDLGSLTFESELVRALPCLSNVNKNSSVVTWKGYMVYIIHIVYIYIYCYISWLLLLLWFVYEYCLVVTDCRCSHYYCYYRHPMFPPSILISPGILPVPWHAKNSMPDPYPGKSARKSRRNAVTWTHGPMGTLALSTCMCPKISYPEFESSWLDQRNCTFL